jgi:riboflavin transporter FmnP
MTPILADAINFPIVLGIGLLVVIPLLLFQMGVEGFLLSRFWRIPFRELRGLTLRANVVSLLAGIPTKIANAFVYAALLPKDIPQFFARYPFAVSVGTLIYFVVTVVVEAAYASKWARRDSVELSHKQIWTGMLWANIATYLVMAPLHYYVTRPISGVREYSGDARWAKNPETKIIFIDPETEHLRSKAFGTDSVDTVVPVPLRAFLVSSNLNVCLYRATNGFLNLWRKEPPLSNVVWQTSERFFLEQVAFSPSGEQVAYLPEDGARVEVVNVRSGKRLHLQLKSPLTRFPHVAWTTEENRFAVAGNDDVQRWLVTISDDELVLAALEGTNRLQLLPSYGRVGRGRSYSGGSWGTSMRNDECEGLSAWAMPGLGSNVRISRKHAEGPSDHLLTIAANPGLLHLGSIWFSEVAFFDGCNECLIGAGKYVYLLDIERKRLGTVCAGEQFITLTPRFLKQLEDRR